MDAVRDNSKSTAVISIAIFVAAFAVYMLTRDWEPSPYNSFIYLADAFLHGRLHLLQNMPWLEVVPFEGKYYIAPPPLPAILSLPAVALFGLSTDQTTISVLFGSLNVSLAYLVARSLTPSRQVQLWSTAMFGFGTVHWWVAVAGGVWTFSQTVSTTFLLASILITLNRKSIFLTGLTLGASYWSRLPTILAFPFYIIMYADKWFKPDGSGNLLRGIRLRPLILFGLGPAIFIALNFIYNLARFHTPFDISYYMIPGVLDESWYEEGIFDISYIPRHLDVFFTALPIFRSEFPYIIPSWNGLAFWITTPAVIYVFLANIRDRLTIACWVSIILVGLVDFCHGTWGFAQFGYRFAMDFYPFLFILTIKGMGDRLKWHHVTLITAGIAVNLWGVLWINKFGWVGV